MAELVRTNDPGMISVIEGLLGGADIPYQVTDRNMSILEGSISAIQIRILVPDEHEAEARELLTHLAQRMVAEGRLGRQSRVLVHGQAGEQAGRLEGASQPAACAQGRPQPGDVLPGHLRRVYPRGREVDAPLLEISPVRVDRVRGQIPLRRRRPQEPGACKVEGSTAPRLWFP